MGVGSGSGVGVGAGVGAAVGSGVKTGASVTGASICNGGGVSTALSAGEVGEACGYRDRAVFFKAFKREVGMSPGAYRASSAR